MALMAGAPEKVIELLVKEAPDVLLQVNKFGETPLHVALRCHSPDDVVEVLTKTCANAIHAHDKQHGNLPIHTAAMNGCTVRVAKDLLELWPEMIHETNGDGLTPMDLALRYEKCSEEIVRLFQITRTTW